ncbi:hypothetical protein SAMN05421832_110150 [Psychrobacillus psychrodurans]|nr:hypothetical protein SAMN05421832_110150 [Psychrobacillus psychrodurans]
MLIIGLFYKKAQIAKSVQKAATINITSTCILKTPKNIAAASLENVVQPSRLFLK